MSGSSVFEGECGGRGSWEKSLPPGVAEEIIENRFFGYRD